MWFTNVLLVLMLVACGKNNPQNYAAVSLAPLEKNIELKKTAYLANLNENGWPDDKDCDGTLWMCLSYAAGFYAEYELAEYESGKIHRRPKPACYDGNDQGAKATTSPDMRTGWLLCLSRSKDYQAAKRFADYAEVNDYVMGDPLGLPHLTLMRPNEIGLLGRILMDLSGGTDKRAMLSIPISYLPVFKDFEQHIQTLGILIFFEHEGYISDQMLKRLSEYAENNPNDPLFQVMHGMFEGDGFKRSIALLNDLKREPPSYVRGSENYSYVHWLFTASLVMKYSEVLK